MNNNSSGIKFALARWPASLPQTRHRQPYPYPLSWEETLQLLEHELRLLGARDVVIQLDMEASQIGADGLPRADAQAATPGVLATFCTADGQYDFPGDFFSTWRGNILAVARRIELMRVVDTVRASVRQRVDEQGVERQLNARLMRSDYVVPPQRLVSPGLRICPSCRYVFEFGRPQVMCSKCWKRVPAELQQRIILTWAAARDQEPNHELWIVLDGAVEEAVEHLRAHPVEKTAAAQTDGHP